MDVSMDRTLNATITPSKLITSTPFKVPGQRPRKSAGKRTFVRPVCDTCKVCGREYRCHRSYVKHMRTHAIQDGASLYPKLEEVLKHCEESVLPTIREFESKYPAFGDMGTAYKKMLQSFLSGGLESCNEWNEFLSIIHKNVTNGISEKKVLLPSALLSTLQTNCEDLLTNVEIRNVLCRLVSVCVPYKCESAVINIFIADYALFLVKDILKFYGQSVKNSRMNEVQSNVKEVVFTLDEKETIHYISGSVVRAFYKKGEKYSKDAKWRTIKTLVIDKFLESERVSGPPAVYSAWTRAQDRGKLFMVSGLVFDFFVGVAEILDQTVLTKRIDHEAVIERVCQSPLLLVWDDIVGDSIAENASYKLMCGMVSSFCNTYGVGHVKKLINSYRVNKAEASVPLRHKVAPKAKS